MMEGRGPAQVWGSDEKILSVLNKNAPLKNIPNRRKYKKWVKDETKQMMTNRDYSRDIANII